MRTAPRLRVIVVGLVLTLGAAGAARAETDGDRRSLAGVSGPRDQVVADCAAGELDGFEGDHAIAARPGEASEQLAVWAQDGETSLGFARSDDGGRSWTAGTVPGFVRCDGSDGPFEYVFDGWASTGPDGRTYVSASVATPSPIPPDPEGGYGVVVAVTPDGGRTWEGSMVVARSIDLLPTDKPTVTADPRIPGRAWVTWTEVSIVGGTSIARIARTDDGGRTWSTPSIHAPPAPVYAEFGNEIVPLPDGSLVRIFSRFSAQPLVLARVWIGGGTTIFAARSDDDGATWTETPVAQLPDSVLRDPETGEDLALGIPFVVADVAADGSDLAVAWAETTPAGRVQVARSADGGSTWSTETVAGSPAPAFRASVAMSGGRIAVTYSDLREDVLGDDELSTRTRLSTWAPGRGWRDRPIGPVHDLRAGATSSATAVPGGDYWGLVLDGSMVVTGLNLPAPHASDGPNDLFAWRGPAMAGA